MKKKKRYAKISTRLLIFISLIALLLYGTIYKQISWQNDKKIDWTPYASTKKDGLIFPTFSMKYPTDWSMREDMDPQGNRALTFAKKNHSLNINQKRTYWVSLCIFNGDTYPTSGWNFPFTDYPGESFVDIETDIGKLRRVQTSPSTGTAFIVCQDQRPKNNYFTNPTTAGEISYKVPANYDSALLLQMDEILKTIKFTDQIPTPTIGSRVAEPGGQCGTIAGIVCPTGYLCKYEGNYPDAAGTCEK